MEKRYLPALLRVFNFGIFFCSISMKFRSGGSELKPVMRI
jgi:hypothetical protein